LRHGQAVACVWRRKDRLERGLCINLP
jgi:hypothetical protein